MLMPTWLDRGFDIRFSSQLKARLKLFAESEGETETVIDGMSGARRRKMVHAIAESCELSTLYCALSGAVVPTHHESNHSSTVVPISIIFGRPWAIIAEIFDSDVAHFDSQSPWHTSQKERVLLGLFEYGSCHFVHQKPRRVYFRLTAA